MSVNPNQVYYTARYLFTSNYSGLNSTTQSFQLDAQASEFFYLSDNINQNLSRYPSTIQVWDNTAISAYTGGTGNGASSDWLIDFGYYGTSNAGYKYEWTYYASGGDDIDENSKYGYVSSHVGGLQVSSEIQNNFLSNNGTSGEVIDVYGHGIPSYPISYDASFQFRNSSVLPVDGSAVITANGSTYSRNKYLHPCFYVSHIVSGGPISGGVSTVLEVLPPVRSFTGNNFLDLSAPNQSYDISWYNGAVNTRQLEYIYSAILWAESQSWHTNKFPDGSGVTPLETHLNEFGPGMDQTVKRYIGNRRKDPRITSRAILQINPEYFAIIYSTFVLVYSAKSSMVPLQAFNLESTFTGTHKRIAGADSNGFVIYVLSEDGELAKIDFTSTPGGTVSTLTSGPSLATGHRYAGLAFASDTNKLWALRGLYALHQWEITESGNPGLSIVDFSIGTGIWGSVRDSGLTNARTGGRDLNQLQYVNGKLVTVADIVVSQTTDIPLLTFGNTSTQGPIGGYSGNWGFTVPLRGFQVRSLSGKTGVRARFRPVVMSGYNISGCKLNALPTGSIAGASYTSSEVINFSGQPGVGFGVGTTIVDSDATSSISIDPSQDYYLYVAMSGYNGSWTFKAHDGVGAAYGVGSLSGTTLTDNLDSSVSNNFYGSAFFDNLYYNSGSAVWLQQTSNGLQDNSDWTYQVATFDTGTTTWYNNTDPDFFTSTPMTESFKTITSYGSLTAFSPRNPNTTATFAPVTCTSHGNYVLIQLGISRKKIFYFDTSTRTLARWNKLPTWVDSDPHGLATLSINTTDGTALIHESASTTDGGSICYAGPTWTMDPGFNWASDTPFSIPWDNTKSVLYNVDTPIHTKGHGLCDRTAFQHDYQGYGGVALFPQTLFPILYSDYALTMPRFIRGPNSGYQQSLYPSGTQINYAAIPKFYYYQGGTWKVTSDWSKAAANAYPVSTTPGTDISAIDGIHLQFGPSAGSTFTAGEFHTINATYGNVKYTRRARYATALFAGQTFKNTETKAMSDILAITPVAFHGDSMAVENVTGATFNLATGQATWPKRNGATWNPDCNSGVYPRIKWHFSAPKNFFDITVNAIGQRGVSWEVSTDGSTWTAITPLWRSHQGYVYVFNRQTGITDVRMTIKQPNNFDAVTFGISNSCFYDYGTQAQVNLARLGSSAAADGDPTRGSWDSQCLGVSHTAILSIDGGSPLLNQCFVYRTIPSPYQQIYSPVDNFYNTISTITDPVPSNKFWMHPFFGFLLMEGAKNGTPSTKSGASASITYFWGRRT